MTPYDSVLAIAKTYLGPAADLGPAAESFLSRQCQEGLKVEAAAITRAHFKVLAHTVEVGACRFIERPKAEDMARRIAVL